MPEGQAIAHDLDPSGVADRHINVHVSDANIARNTRSGLATDTGKGMLERQRPSRKNTRGWQVRGQSAKGRRSRRSSKTRNCALAMVTSSEVGRTVNTRPECGPAWESSRARDAGERSVKCVSSARSSQARLARHLPGGVFAPPRAHTVWEIGKGNLLRKRMQMRKNTGCTSG